MSAAPLTHHEILATVAPFARRGRHVDLAATDRIARRIAFRPREHPSPPDAALPPLRESMHLEPGASGGWRLVRTVRPVPRPSGGALGDTPDDDGNGPIATLVAAGADPQALLEAVDAVAPARQIEVGDGWRLAIDMKLAGVSTRADVEPIPVRGIVLTHGLAIELKVPTVSGISAGIEVTVADDDRIDLPADLLAVLGRRWSRLDRTGRRWSGHVVLAGRGAARHRDAEARMRTLAAHVAAALAEPPARFRERWRGARWLAAARRTVPLAVCAALLAVAIALPHLGFADDSIVWLFALHAPPLMMIVFFTLRELPRIELPRPPPRLPAQWRTAPGAIVPPLDTPSFQAPGSL